MRYAAQTLPFALLLALAGCDEPGADTFESNGGAGADPTGVIEGTVVYSGPPPACDASGHVIGTAVVLLFEYDNPPPPDGLATTAANLQTVPGDRLFASARATLCGCRNDDSCPATVTVSAPFALPAVQQGKAYQIRGFFDTDGDFSPFFAVRNLPTRGDVAGAAVDDVLAAEPRFTRIEVPRNDHGVIVSGVTVTMGVFEPYERPVFTVGWEPGKTPSACPLACGASSDCPGGMICDTGESTCVDDPDHPAAHPCLSGEASLPPVTEGDPIRRENFLFDPLPLRFSILDPTPDDTAAVLGRAGVDFDPGAAHFLVGYQDVDHDLVWGELADDAHPILGSGGVLSYFPVIVLLRNQSPPQLARHEPGILIIATIRPSLVLDPIDGIPPPPRTGHPHVLACPEGASGCSLTVNPVDSIPVVVPPVAVQLLNPTSLECVVPILGPRTDAERFQPRTMANPSGATRYAVCRELPPGGYQINVVNPTGQAWTLPNDLSSAVALDPSGAPHVDPLASQGTVLTVYDPDPDDDPSDGCPSQDAIPPFGDLDGSGSVDPGPEEQLVDFCCAPVRHLCPAELARTHQPPVDPPIPDFCCN